MPAPARHQRLPAAGPAREALRQKGQFWTPPWVADAMVAYALGGGAGQIFDPAVGAGAFLLAAQRIAGHLGRKLWLAGCELDPAALQQAKAAGADIAGVALRDFLDPPDLRRPLRDSDLLAAVVANPPYVRHHRLPAAVKAALRSYSTELLGQPLDGRAGYHAYFLLRALQRLAPGGRLAFILPADIAEGVYAAALWRWIGGKFCIDAAVTFAPDATPFPGVDTNALVVLIRRAEPAAHLNWARCCDAGCGDLQAWVASDFAAAQPTLQVQRRGLAEALATGLSRSPAATQQSVQLGDLVRVVRGVATGANEFFLVTAAEARRWQLPAEWLRRAVGRTRDVPDGGSELTTARLDALDAQGRPTWLLALDGRDLGQFPPAVQRYLKHGEQAGLPLRTLIASRKPWYKTEDRPAPPWLFAYLGRRSARFVCNAAAAVPLTGFLCVYARDPSPAAVQALTTVLLDPRTLANLPQVAKSYGDGALKAEPRALMKLPVPLEVLRDAGVPLPS